MEDTLQINPELSTIQDDIAALKQDVTSLLDHLKIGATTTAQAAATRIDNGAQKLYKAIATEGDRRAKALGQQVEEQPLTALLIALGIGYVAGRLLSR